MNILKILFGASLAIALQACSLPTIHKPYDAPAADFKRVTPIELRVLQTRKFNKPIAEVNKAIETNCKDKNGSGGRFLKCYWWPFEGYYYDDRFRKLIRLTYLVEYDASPDKHSPQDSTIVRMRIYFIKGERQGVRILNEPQVTNPAYYQREFKDLADALFVSAIELTPTEMQ
jgi:hypothetical protein